MRITSVEAFTCDVPLSQPIQLGALRYDSRDYLIVRITTDAGLTGVGYGMARYSPVAQVVERNLAPLLIGEDALLTEHLWERMAYPNLPLGQQGLLMRALSVVDIALWDLKGKAAGLPLYRLLGGHRQRVPVQVAGGFYGATKTCVSVARSTTRAWTPRPSAGSPTSCASRRWSRRGTCRSRRTSSRTSTCTAWRQSPTVMRWSGPTRRRRPTSSTSSSAGSHLSKTGTRWSPRSRGWGWRSIGTRWSGMRLAAAAGAVERRRAL